MKKIKYIILAFIAGSVITMSSCKKETFTDVNVNPNSPSVVTPSALLTPGEVSLAYTIGGDASRFVSIIDQQVTGISRQAAAYNQYVFTSQDVDGVWSNFYTSSMNSFYDLMNQADAKGYNRYSGIARILMAYSMQSTIDIWGKVPYSQAFLGFSNLHPAFDDDNSLYNSTIVNLINVGITKLSATDKGAIFPGADDLIFSGSQSKWLGFAYALKARVYIHQSKGNIAMADSAFAAVTNYHATTSGATAQVAFTTNETASNPWYQFNEQRADIAFNQGTLAALMTANSDPRYTAFIDDTFGDINGVGMGPYYGNPDSPVEFLADDEVNFIEAEAILRSSGNFAAANLAFVAGISSNMTKLGVDAGAMATYIGAHGVLPTTTVNDAIAAVAYEEYVALYLNPEAWSLWRRTASPSLNPTVGSAIPRRLLYPQSEYSYNSANVPVSTLFATKVFWDK